METDRKQLTVTSELLVGGQVLSHLEQAKVKRQFNGHRRGRAGCAASDHTASSQQFPVAA